MTSIGPGGHKDVQIPVKEHLEVADAKRVVPFNLDDSGMNYVNSTVFTYANSDPLAVVLVDETGTAYEAMGSGGGAVTAFQGLGGGGSWVVTGPINVIQDATSDPWTVDGTVAVTQSTSPWVVSGTVTALIGTDPLPVTVDSGTVTANIFGTVNQGTSPWTIAGTVTVHKGDFLRTSTLNLYTAFSVTTGGGNLKILDSNSSRARIFISRASGGLGTCAIATTTMANATSGIPTPTTGGVFIDEGDSVWDGEWWAIASGANVTLIIQEFQD